jgi:SAM-dependent methyltransferase
MRALDRMLQQWRMEKVRPYLVRDSRVLDVGCSDDVLFQKYEPFIKELVGVDPKLPTSCEKNRCRFIAGGFPESVPDAGPFDAITMLAVLEHIPMAEQPKWAAACERLLKPGGYLVITTPSPVVDQILAVLKWVRLIDGMSLEEHYGFDPTTVPSLFAIDTMALVASRKFQLGCNNLFVFQKRLN